ncbi:MAG: hypothetical protein ABIJ34_05315 [archaeon]
MKKIYLLILILFLSSCATDNSSSKTNWRTGTQGIVMSYMSDNPPSEIVSKSKVNVMVKYSNKGATSTSPTFYLTGYDSSILAFSGPSKSVGNIYGKDQYNPEGSQEGFVEWNTGINMASLEQVDSFKQSLSVTACYSYQTYATPSICIDPNKYEYIGPSRCDYDIKDLGDSQGAPIAITQVKQKSAGDDIYLELHFANKGSGTPFVSGDCMKLGYDEVNIIKLSEVSISGKKFDCTPTDIRLISNSGFAVCSQTLANKDSSYDAIISIKLDYKYRESLPKKEITIVNVNKKK